MATSPAGGEGVECTPGAAADCGVPVDAPLQLRFDRLLLPSTAVRQSIVVRTGDHAVFLSPRYDPLEGVVVYRLPGGGRWLPGVRYSVELVLPEEHPVGWGFRAFDGASIADEGSLPLRFTFRVRLDSTPTGAPPSLPPSFAAVRDVFERGGCSAGGCHHRAPAEDCAAASGDACDAPRMGLDLSDAESFARTVLDHVAHGADLGTSSLEPQIAPARFGVGMPLIAPASSGNSYLLYKLLVNERFPTGEPRCATRYDLPLAADCAASFAAERERLRAWFVRGSPMPLTEDGPGPRLSIADLATLERWISAGAPLD